ncbi:hypothetical protein M422DRAFT_172422 [Sphaerobolus stellatus SS14]|uniref:DNA breaking-rejoining enzyme n=1 Tax=Sphaerobolus stellatus (strain SS14) TaxID=990650 RepID=A0A0C9VTD1_SPHS4|nr:hypothetical protein M422DRAFT_172422 [Sphaerobolus stellatus SS14]
MRPSALRPTCKADEQIFRWIGVNKAPRQTIDHSLINTLAELASRASLRDTSSYGAGLRKFHIFCDVFSIPEMDRLPASFAILHSFALWAAADPESISADLTKETPLEPISVTSVKKYLSAIRAWHIVQGWPPPLSQDDQDRITGHHSRPPRPGITIRMLKAIKLSITLDKPYGACIWAICLCMFWGMMHAGEAMVIAQKDFNGKLHLKRSDIFFDKDTDGKLYACLDLPSAKTARPGRTKSVFITEQGDLCPIAALRNLFTVVPARASDPLFCWRDEKGGIRPMVKQMALKCINDILNRWGWGTTFGHSFRIGGASYYLAQKVDPEIIRIAGRWRSMAYETYIRAFEQTAS